MTPRRVALVLLLCLTAFAIGLTTSFYGIPGQTTNGGFTFHPPFTTMYYGLEVWGNPGPFSENCQAGC